MSEKKSFEFTYSAKKYEEIQRIRRKFGIKDSDGPVSEDSYAGLKRLDRQSSKTALIVSLAVGLIGTMVLGGGMSMILAGSSRAFYPGITIGVFGIALIASAYPLYKRINRKRALQKAQEMMNRESSVKEKAD